MKRAIAIHRRDFIAILGLVVLAGGTTAYILGHQASFTLGQSYYSVNAQFSSAAAVTPGQGQTVDVAGVQVGDVGAVKLQDGRAVVRMDIYKRYAPIYRDATVLLRPRTPLKDMYLSLDPGTPAAGKIPTGGTLPVSNTQPDVNFEEILASLDVDTRNYLLLLLSGGAQAFRNPGNPGPAPSGSAVADLQGTFKRFAPLGRDTAELTRLLAVRRANIARAIHNLQVVTNTLGGVSGQLVSLIRSSNTNFSAISSQDAALSQALTQLPGTLQQTDVTLGKVQGFAGQSTVALHRLIPFAQALSPALQAARPLFRDTTPVIRDQLRPFARAVQPVARVLRPAAASLAAATPPLTRAVNVLNALLNTLAYQPGGGQNSYLFWGSWLSHVADSLTNTQDAHGALVRGVFMANCPQLNLFEVTLVRGNPALGPLIQLLNAPDWSKIKSSYCPVGGL